MYLFRTNKHRVCSRYIGIVLTVIACILLLSGCSSSGASTDPIMPTHEFSPTSKLDDLDLSGANLSIGSKEYTEQLVIAHLARIAMESVGAKVDDQIGAYTTYAARQALIEGEIDMYWEYTGTAWREIFRNKTNITDSAELLEAVRKEDLTKNSIRWMTPAPFDNTYAIAVKQETAKKYNLKKISDLGGLLKSNPELVTVCGESEFVARTDGLPGMMKAYDLKIPAKQIFTRDTVVVYTSIAEADPCIFGEVFILEARIESLGLTVLEDDKRFFPEYSPAITMLDDTFKKYPDFAELFARFAPKLTDDVVRDLCAEVDIDGKLPEQVAEEWLRDEGFIR